MFPAVDTGAGGYRPVVDGLAVGAEEAGQEAVVEALAASVVVAVAAAAQAEAGKNPSSVFA